MAKKTHHLHYFIEGLLKESNAHLLTMVPPDEKGDKPTPDEIRAYFQSLKDLGHIKFPFTPLCEGFSPITGCPGHDIPVADEE